MEPLSNNFILTEKSSTWLLLKFWGYFTCRIPGAPKKAPFMYVEICPWVILFNPKLENEVLNDIQTCRFEKHGFFRFWGWPARYWQLLGLHFGLQSLKNATIINFRKKMKIFVIYHFCWKCTSFDVQPHRVKWY